MDYSKRYYFKDDKLILEYSPYRGVHLFDLHNQLSKNDKIRIAKIMEITLDNIEPNYKNVFKLENYVDSIYINIGKLSKDGNYVMLDKKVFGIEYNFYFEKSITLYHKYLAKEGVSIVKILSRCVKNDIYVDSNKNFTALPNHLSLEMYKKLLKMFPNDYEVNLYKKQSAEIAVKNYFNIEQKYIDKYESYICKKRNLKQYNEIFSLDYYNSKLTDLQSSLQYLKDMMNENSNIPELEWQKAIADILYFIYPKYLFLFQNFKFPSLNKIKKPDFIAIDNDGNVDIIEIKKSNIGKITRKYRDNYVPTSEISCANVQIEQYIFYMMSNKEEIEKLIEEQYKDKIGDLKINIINPQGILIAGRSDNLNEAERKDLEVAKRMNKNIYDLVTYDVLIKRLDNSIKALKIKIQNLKSNKAE